MNKKVFIRFAGAGTFLLLTGTPAVSPANGLQGCLELHPGGINLKVFVPEDFTNRVEIYSCTDLISNVWDIAVQDISPSGTNPAVWSTGTEEPVRFFKIGNMNVDRDHDGLPDARELYYYKTDPNHSDTDGDGIPDGWEIQYGLNPSLYADGGFDLDGDGLLNKDEYVAGTNPDGSGEPASLAMFNVIFYQPTGF